MAVRSKVVNLNLYMIWKTFATIWAKTSYPYMIWKFFATIWAKKIRPLKINYVYWSIYNKSFLHINETKINKISIVSQINFLQPKLNPIKFFHMPLCFLCVSNFIHLYIYKAITGTILRLTWSYQGWFTALSK